MGRRFFIIICLVLGFAGMASAQSLRFTNHREQDVPKYATLRIGPFYSSLTFSEEIGYRFTASEGEGTDYITDNNRGKIKEDGSDFPMITTLNFRNYIFLTRKTDLDFSFEARYEYYPMDTQDNVFYLDLAEEGLFGNISMEFGITPFVKMTVFNDAAYRTDYVDTRGVADPYGGGNYQYFRNTFGVDFDWLMTRRQNMAVSLSRTDNFPVDDDYTFLDGVMMSESLIYENMLSPFVLVGSDFTFGQNDYSSDERVDTVIQTYSVFSTVKLTKKLVATASLGYSLGTISGLTVGTGEEDSDVFAGSLSLIQDLSRSLSQTLTYGTGQRSGYNSAFEVFDNIKYEIKWEGRMGGIFGFFTELNSVEPSSDINVNSYTDWRTGVDVTVPLLSYVDLIASTSYVIRENGDVSSLSDVTELEWLEDYDTWNMRIGTAFALTETVGFSTYVQQVRRISTSELLAYERNTIAAFFKYDHKF